MTAEQRKPWPRGAGWPLALLTFISVFNYLDRSLLGLALPAIKAEFGASDTALGLVSGLAFVLLYTVLGIPIAWLADRSNRRNIIAIGLAFWSAMTALTGFAGNIWQLAICRFLMGAGEACGLAPSNSIIAQLFPVGRRQLAMAIFGTANSIAFIVFFPIAGWIADNYGWRGMFMAMGLPGIVLALVFVLTIKEPPRPDLTARAQRLSPRAILGDIAALCANRCYFWLFVGTTLMGANVWAAGAWTPSFLVRVHQLSLGEIASIIGPTRGLVGAAGILAGGWIIDRLSPRRLAWRLVIPSLACMMVGPAEMLFLLADNDALWIGGFMLASIFTLIHQAPIFAACVTIVPEARRALAVAVLLFGAGFIGNIIGPGAVGMLNDWLAPQHGAAAIRYSLLLIAATPVLAGLCYWRAAPLYRDLLAGIGHST